MMAALLGIVLTGGMWSGDVAPFSDVGLELGGRELGDRHRNEWFFEPCLLEDHPAATLQVVGNVVNFSGLAWLRGVGELRFEISDVQVGESVSAPFEVAGWLQGGAVQGRGVFSASYTETGSGLQLGWVKWEGEVGGGGEGVPAPEPGSLGLLLVGGGTLVAKRRGF